MPSLTATWKVSVVFANSSGAVNVGEVALVLLSVTPGPAVCVHVYVSPWPSGSDEPAAVSVTPAPSATVWSGPAFAVGASLSALTVIDTVS